MPVAITKAKAAGGRSRIAFAARPPGRIAAAGTSVPTTVIVTHLFSLPLLLKYLVFTPDASNNASMLTRCGPALADLRAGPGPCRWV